MYRVMIADDEIIIREGLTNFINWNKLNCSLEYIAENGIEAIEYLQRSPVDILITDIRMPGRSGLDIAQYISDKKLPIKTIILSGYSDFKYAQKALQTGAIDFILKDNPLEKVESAIIRAIVELKEQKENTDLLHNLKHSMTQTEEEVRVKFILDLINDISFSSAKLDEKEKLFPQGSKGIYCVLFQVITSNNTDKIDSDFFDSIIKFLNKIYANGKPTVFPLHSNTLCMVLSNATSFSESLITQTFNQLFVLIEKFQNYQIRIAISSIHEKITDINKAYLQCLYCLKHNAASHKKVFFYNDESIFTPQNNRPIINKAIRYMEYKYASQITLQDIANQVSLNPSYFSRIFKKETNESVTGYLTKYRIEKAKELLMDDSFRLSEIAESVGFNDVSYFSNTFKKITGYSPSDFRTISTYKENEY